MATGANSFISAWVVSICWSRAAEYSRRRSRPAGELRTLDMVCGVTPRTAAVCLLFKPAAVRRRAASWDDQSCFML